LALGGRQSMGEYNNKMADGFNVRECIRGETRLWQNVWGGRLPFVWGGKLTTK
jgi:hypothetical protein